MNQQSHWLPTIIAMVAFEYKRNGKNASYIGQSLLCCFSLLRTFLFEHWIVLGLLLRKRVLSPAHIPPPLRVPSAAVALIAAAFPGNDQGQPPQATAASWASYEIQLLARAYSLFYGEKSAAQVTSSSRLSK